MSLSITGQGPISLRLENNSPGDICYVYLRPSGDLAPTQNLLEQMGNVLRVDDTKETEGIPPGTYDLSVAACTSNLIAWADRLDLSGQVIVEIGGTTLSGNPTVDLILTNLTSTKICSVWYGQPYSEWIGDLLGGRGLTAGSSATVQVPVHIWAVQARDCSGNPIASAWSLDVTQSTEWQIRPDP